MRKLWPHIITSDKPHDGFTKFTLGNTRIAKDFLKGHLSQELLKRIDLDVLTTLDKSTVSTGLKQYHKDLLYQTQLEDESDLFLHIEAQSTVENMMAFRVLEYTLAFMRRYNAIGHKKLPTMVSCVLYHGPTSPYSSPLDLSNCFEHPDLVPIATLRPFYLIDLTILSDSTLEQHGTAGLMEKLLKYSSRKEAFFTILSDELDRNRAELQGDVVDTPLGGDYWKATLTYALSVVDPTLHSSEKILNLYKDKLSKTYEEVMTIAKQLEKIGELRGERIGEKRGMLRGEKIGELKGAKTRNLEIAKNMLGDRASVEKIKKWTGLTQGEIEKLSQMIKISPL